jgi:hypothetical protein
VASVIGLAALSACGLPPISTSTAPAAASQPCAKIAWRDLGTARDLNGAIFAYKGDAAPTRLAYGPGPRPEALTSGENEELDLPLRSERSVDLSNEVRREYEKQYVQGVEQWVQAHLAIEMRSCPS